MNETLKFQEGALVRKVRGYEFPGVVVAAFNTTRGDARYVIEHTTVKGLLHIFNGEQLELADRE